MSDTDPQNVQRPGKGPMERESTRPTGFLQRILERKDSERTYISYKGTDLSFREVIGRASGFLSSLHKMGLDRGDRVVVRTSNNPFDVEALIGCLIGGVTFIPVAKHLPKAGLDHVLKDSGARLLIDDVEAADLTDIIVIKPDEVEHDLISPTIDPDLDPGTESMIIYTTGSTGLPKGVVLTYSNISFSVWSINTYIGNREDDVILNCLPLSFDYGLYQSLFTMDCGGRMVLEEGLTFGGKIISLIEKERVTGLPIVAPMIDIIFRRLDTTRNDLSSLRYISNTAQKLPVGSIRKLREKLPDVSIISMYGLTECKRCTYLDPAKIDEKPESVGNAIPGTRAILVDSDQNVISEPFSEGELVIIGPNIMKCYLNDPSSTDKVIKKINGERALFTGDIFHFDPDGDLYFHGRNDDLMKVSGEKVYPGEIERTLLSLEDITSAVVLGIEHDQGRVRIIAFIKGTEKVDTLSMKKQLRVMIEPYKIPDIIIQVDDIPINQNGKVDRKGLRDMYLDSTKKEFEQESKI